MREHAGMTEQIKPPIIPSKRGEFGTDGLVAGDVVGSPTGVRLACSIVALACLSVLMVAAYLRPSEQGLGTHEQLGLPACGWIVAADLPCPTCGMTTAFSHAANGDLYGSIGAQPFGALLAVFTATVVVAAGWTALTGSRLAPFMAGLFGRRIGWFVLGMFIAAWIWKIFDHKGFI